METYLVLCDVTLSTDGGRLSLQHQVYWVTATDKQKAATLAAHALKAVATTTYIAHKITHVVAQRDWGNEYFPTVREEKEAEPRGTRQTRKRLSIPKLEIVRE